MFHPFRRRPLRRSFRGLIFSAILLALCWSGVDARPPHSAKPPTSGPSGKPKAIGPEGGTVNAGNDSYLWIPEGALTETVEIVAQSTNSAIPQDTQAIGATLSTAIDLLELQEIYIDALPSSDDGSGEWAKPGTKNTVRGKNEDIEEYAEKAWNAFKKDDGWSTLVAVEAALHAADKLDQAVSGLMDDNQPKMGSVACATILENNRTIQGLLEGVHELYDATLLFEFGPHGLEFLIPAELVVPLDYVLIADEFAWYSGDGGESIEISSLDYFVDEEAGTIHFLIPHFSQYYYRRK